MEDRKPGQFSDSTCLSLFLFLLLLFGVGYEETRHNSRLERLHTWSPARSFFSRPKLRQTLALSAGGLAADDDFSILESPQLSQAQEHSACPFIGESITRAPKEALERLYVAARNAYHDGKPILSDIDYDKLEVSQSKLSPTTRAFVFKYIYI